MYKLKEVFFIKTNLPKAVIKSVLENGISDKSYWISITSNIITGKLENDSINGVINSPTGFINPFGSKIRCNIADNILDFKITVNKYLLIFLFMWVFLCLLSLVLFEYQNFISSLGVIILMFLFAIVPALFIKLNLKWEKWRIKNWVENEINKYIKYQNIFSKRNEIDDD